MLRRALDFRSLPPILLLATAMGCTSILLRPQAEQETLEELASEDSKFISTFTHPYGLDYVKVEAISLATGLDGTGGDPPPTAQRASLLDEMKRRRVNAPNEVLASPDTSLVLLRGYLRPGMREGDRFDVEVQTPTRSDTTSLRGGWVLPARMTELAVLGNQVHSGHILAVAEGALLVDPSADPDTEAALSTHGRILGGAVAVESRPLGLVIDQEHKSVRLSQAIAKEINLRFHSYRDGRKSGMATAKTDEFVELILHDRYKDNITRYIKVVRNLTVDESPDELQIRMKRLETQLVDPLTSAKAALRLEAKGTSQAIEILEGGLDSKEPEVRFYSAEALAYLDQTSAVEALAQATRQEPAFRINALAALSAMDDIVAYDALRSLLAVRSAETRYGAFRALWSMNSTDPLIRGERLGDQFGHHLLDVKGPPMIHVTRSFRPELVLFGLGQRFRLPMVLDAGKNIMVNGMEGEQVTVSRFVAGEPAEKRVVSPDVDAVVRAIVQVGGGYPDVVQALQQAKKDGALPDSRFAVDALPEPGRAFQRRNVSDHRDESNGESFQVATPLPDLFSRKK